MFIFLKLKLDFLFKNKKSITVIDNIKKYIIIEIILFRIEFSEKLINCLLKPKVLINPFSLISNLDKSSIKFNLKFCVNF